MMLKLCYQGLTRLTDSGSFHKRISELTGWVNTIWKSCVFNPFPHCAVREAKELCYGGRGWSSKTPWHVLGSILTSPGVPPEGLLGYNLILKEMLTSIFLNFYYFYFMCMHVCLYVCRCTMCAPGACRDQMKESGPLELELQNIVRHHMGSENRNWVLCKRSKHS